MKYDLIIFWPDGETTRNTFTGEQAKELEKLIEALRKIGIEYILTPVKQ